MRARMGPALFAEWCEFLAREAVGGPYEDARLKWLALAIGGLVAGKAPELRLPWERAEAPAAAAEIPPEEDRMAPAALYRQQALSPEASVRELGARFAKLAAARQGKVT